MPNTDKRNRLKSTVIVVAMALLPLATQAAGLGKITVLSALGQPLKAELEVSATRDEAPSLVAKVASADAFRQAGIDYSPALGSLRFSRDIKERGGRRFLEVTTDRPLNEPFVDMLVELTWASGRLVREYTFLLDPPDLAPRLAPAPIAAPELRAETAVPKPAERVAPDAAPAPPLAVARRLPPPRPVPAEQPATKPVSEASRTVVAGDTLGKIAAQTKPEGVSLDQMLVSLFRSNREVFDGGNMNRLRAGKILAIPDVEAASSIPAGEARKEIVAQAADFNAYRKRLAAAAAAEPAREQIAQQSVSGKIAPKVEDKAPLVVGKDKLEVSRTEVARDAKDKPLQGRIATLEEDLVARDRALKEASSRIADLEKNLGDMKKLAELKSQAGAELQKQAQAAKPAPVEAKKPEVPPPAVKPAEPVKPVEAPKAVEPPKPPEPPMAVEAAKPPEVAKPAETMADAKLPEAAKPVEAPKPPPPPPKKKFVPPPPEPEPNFIEDNPELVFGGGAVVALLLGWLGFSAFRRKRATATESVAPPAESDLMANSMFSSASVAPPPNEQEASQFSTTGMGTAGHQEAVDPVIEAETFLAFGRDAQAEEILLDALKTDPQRQAVHLKLLDIYSARKNAPSFETVAKQLLAVSGGFGPTWEKAVAMGATLDPGNSLYGAVPSAPATVLPDAEFDMEATTILDRSLAVEQPAPTPAPVPASETEVLDFDLDMDIADATSTSLTAPTAAAEPEVMGLDFDLELGGPTPPAAVEAEAPAAGSEIAALDIDFDMPPGEATVAPLDFPLAAETPPDTATQVTEPPQAPEDFDSIDFEFDLGTPEAPALEPLPEAPQDPVAAAPAPLPHPNAIDFSGISLELDAPEAVSEAVAEAPAAVDIPDNPEVATKIELALAYEEMGDRDGARELFLEAEAEGSPAQQKVARAKLDSLG